MAEIKCTKFKTRKFSDMKISRCTVESCSCICIIFYNFIDSTFVSRCSTKELRKKTCINGLYYACDAECPFCWSLMSYLLPSLIDAEQCRQSMTFMVFEGMHILAMCVSNFFRDDLNGHPVLLAKFCLFTYIRYTDYC